METTWGRNTRVKILLRKKIFRKKNNNKTKNRTKQKTKQKTKKLLKIPSKQWIRFNEMGEKDIIKSLRWRNMLHKGGLKHHSGLKHHRRERWALKGK